MSLLGLDLGTTGCKAAVFALDGRCLGLFYREYPTSHPRAGWAELDAPLVWQRVQEVIALAAAAAKGDPVTALSISSFGEATFPVSADRQLLGNAILCIDDRGAEHVEALRSQVGEEAFYRINANPLGAHYSLPKLLWLREHSPQLVERADKFLLAADWVAFMLGCEAVASNSLASRTLLLDVHANQWSKRLLDWSGWPVEKLGRVVPGGTVIGTVAPAAAAALGLPPNVAVVAGGHDQCCNALGCGCVTSGSAACGIGTFECITPLYTMPGDFDAFRLAGLNIEHHVIEGLFVSFLFNQAGSLVKWFRQAFAADRADEADLYAALNRELPDEPTDLLVLPHFEPPLWPHPILDSGGAIVGLRTTTTRGEILRAVMESATLFFADALERLDPLKARPTRMVASGGGARSDVWMQIHADVLGLPFERAAFPESGCLGAAMLAGLATGVLANPAQATQVFARTVRTFEPDDRRRDLYRQRLDVYRRLYPALKPVLADLRNLSVNN